MNRQELESKTVRELQTIARGIAREVGFLSSPIVGLSKDELIQTILERRLVTSNNSATVQATVPATDDSSLIAAIASALHGRVGANSDEIMDLVNNRLAEFSAAITGKAPIKIQIADGPPINTAGKHFLFPRVLENIVNNIDVMLVGPAGSGKTTLVQQIAEALELPFYCQSFCAQSSKSDLIGFNHAAGGYVTTPLRLAYENGGIYLGDELDNGNPNILNALNALLDNGIASFPDKQVKRHPDFHCIGATNTFGLGGDVMYVGRNQMDAAFRERFVFMNFPYDENLEESLTDNKAWFRRVIAIRQAALDLREKLVVSPRATIKGSKLLALGWSQDEVEDAVIFKGCNAEIKSRVLAHV